MGLLDHLFLGGASPFLPQGSAFPGMPSGLTEEEIAAASRPAMFGFQNRMGGLGPALNRAAAGVRAAQPFDRGADPIMAPPSGPDMGLGAFLPQGGGMNETGGSIQPDGERAPMPRPRPGGIDISARGAGGAAPAGDPMSLAPPAPMAPPMAGAPQQAAPSAGSGFLQSISDNTPLLLALAGGFAGAPSFGTGMRRAFSAAAPVAAASQKQDREQKLLATSRDQIFRDLVAKGVPPADARAAAGNPVILKEIADKVYGAGKEPKAPEVRRMKVDGGERDMQWSAQGGWQPVPGSVVDPGDKRRNLSVSDLEKLSDEATKFRAIERYSTGFKDDYAGDIIDAVGDAKNWSGRNNPLASRGSKDRSAWWQDYSQYRNAVRHDLFGSALTAPEKAAFLESDITPGMQPDMIRRNLARQQDIVTNALKRKGGALIEGGSPKGQVAKIYGVDPSFFDDKPAPKTAGSVTVGGKPVSWKLEPDDD